MANARVATLSFLLITIVTLSVSTVDAQNTTLTNLVYPTAIVSGETATVTFDLSYSGLASTEGLIAAILDPVTNDIVNGMASSSPNQCISLATTQYTGRAACAWRINSTSGTERLTFEVQFPGTHIQPYGFVAVSTIVTSMGVLLGLSVESFSITGGTTFELTVETGYPVAIIVDNSAASSPIELTPGIHVISVPRLVQLDNSSRLRFDHWDDGSTNPNRTMDIQSDSTIHAAFVRQYLLTLISPHGNATGSGWYDVGSTANFSVPDSLQMPGMLGDFGARLDFKGWYENGFRFTSVNTGTTAMLTAHTITALWVADYFTPIAIFIAIGASVSISIMFLGSRKTRSQKRSRRRRRTRRRKR